MKMKAGTLSGQGVPGRMPRVVEERKEPTGTSGSRELSRCCSGCPAQGCRGAGSHVCWTRASFIQRRDLWAPNGWARCSMEERKVQERRGRETRLLSALHLPGLSPCLMADVPPQSVVTLLGPLGPHLPPHCRPHQLSASFKGTFNPRFSLSAS